MQDQKEHTHQNDKKKIKNEKTPPTKQIPQKQSDE